MTDAVAQLDDGIKLYMKQHGDEVAGKKIELIRRDTGGLAPDVAKRLAQELLVRDKVDISAALCSRRTRSPWPMFLSKLRSSPLQCWLRSQI